MSMMQQTEITLVPTWTLGVGGRVPSGAASGDQGGGGVGGGTGNDSGALGTPTTPAGGQGEAGGPPAPPPNPFGGSFMLILLGLFLLMIFMSIFAGRKEKKRRKEMMASLSKHDRVQTSGGLIGTIVEVKDDEVTLKVDESTNTRIRFAKSAVTSVLKSANRSVGAETVSS
jgi:preprotein translocase subunit YajC